MFRHFVAAPRAAALLLLPLSLNSVPEAQTCPGRIVVSSDEWFLSNTGFNAQPASAAAFVSNLTAWFTGGGTGSFLAYSSNFSLTGSRLGESMVALSHSWTVNATEPWTLQNLLTYDGIFLAATQVPDLSVLGDYVQAGGNVFLAAGTSSDAASTASYWNPFLAPFGLVMDDVLDGLCFGGCSLTISSSNPLLQGVTALYHDRGQDVGDIAAADPRNLVIAEAGGHERFAIFDGQVDTVPPSLSCPPAVLVIDAKGGAPGEIVSFSVAATDDTDPVPSIVCVPPSGSYFPRGVTMVTCTATDASGNRSVCMFPVVVQPTVRSHGALRPSPGSHGLPAPRRPSCDVH